MMIKTFALVAALAALPRLAAAQSAYGKSDQDLGR